MKTMKSKTKCITEKVLARLGESWFDMATVKFSSFNDLHEDEFDESEQDFDLSLIPFADSIAHYKLSDHQLSKLLSCAWLIYNEKTIYIELDIITPLCKMISQSALFSWASRIIATEVLIDEAYHTLISLKSSQIIRQKRHLEELIIDEYSLAASLKKVLDSAESEHQKLIIMMAAATVSETFISEYLAMLSSRNDVQPINQRVAAIHLKDEIRHGNIFKQLSAEFYSKLASEDKKYFIYYIRKSAKWFMSQEYHLWSRVLNQIGLDNRILLSANFLNKKTNLFDDYSSSYFKKTHNVAYVKSANEEIWS